MPLPLPIIAPRERSDSPESDAERARRRPATLAALVSSPAADARALDDGTHDVFSEAYASVGDVEDGDASSNDDRLDAVPVRRAVVAAAEMRQVLAVPVSLSAYL